MSTFKMKEESLVDTTNKIISIVEERISKSLYDIDNILDIIEKEIFISQVHFNKVFIVATGIRLRTYIRRRIYTSIIKKMDKEKFDKLRKEELYGIRSFKNKCLKEFPFLAENFDSSKMQVPISQEMIYLSIMKQAKTKNINPIVTEIAEGRTLVNIPKLSSKILIQDDNNTILDLDKTYFEKENIIFNINSNVTMRDLSKFFNEGCELTGPIYVYTSLVSANSNGFIRGSASLILSTSCKNNKIYKIELSDSDFIVFDKGKVWINTDFYIKNLCYI